MRRRGDVLPREFDLREDARKVERSRDFSVYRLDPAINERAFIEHVRRLAIEGGWLYYHTYRSTRSAPGFPDVVMVKGGFVIFAELKDERGKPSAEQQLWLATLTKAARPPAGNRLATVEVYLWRPRDFEQIARRLLS